MIILEPTLELERQLHNIRSVYAAFADMSDEQLQDTLQRLLPLVRSTPPKQPGVIPFVVVPMPAETNYDDVMAAVQFNGKSGMVNTTPVSPQDFQDIEPVPASQLYLLQDVDTGKRFLNISPEDCLKTIRQEGRVPLTLREGVALVVHFPEVLSDKDNYNCIQMPGSRIEGDQRVPSIWISYKRPRLGWCWDRNIHTWLGSASAAHRAA